jgi:agmatine/peptidylarginine deiminase
MTGLRTGIRIMLLAVFVMSPLLITALTPSTSSAQPGKLQDLLIAQTDKPQEQLDRQTNRLQDLPIGLTEEEMTRLDEIGKFHTITAPPDAPIRRPAQWEPVTGALIRYNYGFGLPYDLIAEYSEDIMLHILCTSSQQTTCYNNLQANGVNMSNVTFLNISTNSMWTRDYGPQGVFADGTWSIVDHIYNRPRPLDDQVNWELGTEWSVSVHGTTLEHTGGNFLYDGHGTGFSTDLVWDENPGMSHSQIAAVMKEYLGIEDYVVVPDISSTGIHHIDCWMKVLNEETLLVKEVWSGHPDYAQLEANVATFEGLTNCYGRPYNIVRVYCGSIGGNSVAAYTNSMILNNKVFVPVYGISTDAAALATYEAAMPGYEVFGFDGSWLSDDAIHCRTMELHDREMLVVDTNPLQDQEYNTGDYRIKAFIDDLSGAGLVPDSLLVYWRLEGSPGFSAIEMETCAHPDSFYADIPMQADSADVEYYVFARDGSARRSFRPPVAPGAWYSFNTGATDPSAAEDVLSGRIASGIRLSQNSPNPFASATEIAYELPADSHVRLDVFDVTGRKVATLVDGHRSAGPNAADWSGRSEAGRELPGGVYFYRIQAGDLTQIRKMVLLK